MNPIISQDAMRIVAQAIELLSRPALPFEAHIGSHMRHIIEHFESLLNATARVDYDDRARDVSLQTNRAVALQRLTELHNRLSQLTAHALAQPIEVCLRCGEAGEFESISQSTVARELMFVASHATHHYAIIKLHCASLGINMAASFGKAPATVAFEQTNLRSIS